MLPSTNRTRHEIKRSSLHIYLGRRASPGLSYLMWRRKEGGKEGRKEGSCNALYSSMSERVLSRTRNIAACRIKKKTLRLRRLSDIRRYTSFLHSLVCSLVWMQDASALSRSVRESWHGFKAVFRKHLLVSMLPGPAVPGCWLFSLYFLCYILCSRSVK